MSSKLVDKLVTEKKITLLKNSKTKDPLLAVATQIINEAI